MRHVPTISKLVSIDTHSLLLNLWAPQDRSHFERPLVIIFVGAGEVAISWAYVANLISAYAPVLTYDRSGLGVSERGPNPATGAAAAHEMSALLKAAAQDLDLVAFRPALRSPYVLCAHSFGGVIAREFVHLHPSLVAGLVLVDPATEHDPMFFKIADPDLDSVIPGVQVSKYTGLKADCILSADEWAERSAAIRKGLTTWNEERSHHEETCASLAEKKQMETQAMGEKPVVVILASEIGDNTKLALEGIRRGNGTEEQRQSVREMLEKWPEWNRTLKENLRRLGSNVKMVDNLDCGHNINLLRPQAIADEVQRVLEAVTGTTPATKL